ncbi:MAG: hypothetical protein LBS61_02810 [Endomicrobium sp.]|jgi:hypothetical protein|nr:hypothetical protein [Endomicrobium sp.]
MTYTISRICKAIFISSDSWTEFGKIISDNYAELLEFYTLIPAVERLISDVELNNNFNNPSNSLPLSVSSLFISNGFRDDC